MREGISKKELIKSLESTLKLTREEITRLELKDEETVIIYFQNDYKKTVNIACNSGIAIIRDISKAI